MRMIRALRRWLDKVAPAETASEAPSYLDAWSTTRTPDASSLIRRYQSVAYSCANINAQAIASAGFRLYSGPQGTAFTTKAVDRDTAQALRKVRGFTKKVAGEIREVTSHPLLSLLENANELMDGFALLELTSLYLDFTGVAYWLMESEVLMGTPVKLWILPTHLMEVKRDREGKVVEYKYGAKKVSIDPEKIVRFSLPSMRDPYHKGIGPAEAAFQLIELLGKDLSWATALMENRARPDTMLSIEGIGAVQAERMERKLNRKFRRSGAGGIWVTDGESMNVKPLTFPPKDMEAQGRFQLTKTMIHNVFGVPIALSEGERINRATLEAALYQHARLAVYPRLVRFSQRVNQRLVPRFGDNLFFWFDNPIPQDEKLRAQVRKTDLDSGHRTINDTRVEDGLDPVPWGDKPWLPSGLQQPSSDVALNERSRPEPKPAGKEVGQAFVDGCTAAFTALLAKTQTATTVQTKTPSIGKGHRRKLPTGEAIGKAIRPVFRRQRLAVEKKVGLKGFDTISGDWSSTANRLSKAWGDHISLEGWDKVLHDAAYPAFEMYAEEGAEDVRARLGLSDDPAFQVRNPKMREALNEAAMDFCKETNDTTEQELNTAIKDLKDRLAEGMITVGDVPRELSKAVQHVFTKLDRSRADRIALTESSRATHLAQVLVAKESGLVEGFEWLLSDDACELCQELKKKNPKGIPLEGDFGKVSDHPTYGVVRYPPAHPHCMCTLTEKLIPPDELEEAEGKVPEWVDVKSWEEAESALNRVGAASGRVYAESNVSKNKVLPQLNTVGMETARLRNEHAGLRKLLGESYDSHPIRSITFYDTKNLNLEERKGLARVDGYATPNARSITLGMKGKRATGSLRIGGTWNVENSVAGLWRHEMGHLVQTRVGKKDWISVMQELSDRELMSVSKYARTDPDEYFAECFTAYTHPDYKKRKVGELKLPSKVEAYLKKIVDQGVF